MEQQINNLQDLAAQKEELRVNMEKSEKEIKNMWNELFHKKNPTPTTPTQKLLSLASSSAGLIDGAILGWKLYKKFRK